jgi:hypothetical protein
LLQDVEGVATGETVPLVVMHNPSYFVPKKLMGQAGVTVLDESSLLVMSVMGCPMILSASSLSEEEIASTFVSYHIAEVTSPTPTAAGVE